ncbi:hypothetical protein IFM89_002643, partial [Coptis chinensis]
MAEKKTISIKLLVDKEKNKVLFAESNKDFADVLFSFLTIPIGTIVRLAEKQSKLGCIDALYQSVETLDTDYFKTGACKSMLLMPRSAYQHKHINLAVNICGHTCYYGCPIWTCLTETNCLLSCFKNTLCQCGQEMDKQIRIKLEKFAEGDDLTEVFIKGNRKFIISDDLLVRKASIFPILCKFAVKATKSVEERIVCVGVKEVLNLLLRSLVSKTPLSDVSLSKRNWINTNMIGNKSGDIKFPIPRTGLVARRVSLTLLVERREEKVLYAVAEEDFLDFLLSFLAFPVGSMVELLEPLSSISSVSLVNKLGVPLSDLEERVVSVGEKE